jgi:hypothetical protein
VISAAIAAFVMLASEGGQRGKGRDSSKDAFAVVRVQSRLVALSAAQWARLVPDRT